MIKIPLHDSTGLKKSADYCMTKVILQEGKTMW